MARLKKIKTSTLPNPGAGSSAAAEGNDATMVSFDPEEYARLFSPQARKMAFNTEDLKALAKSFEDQLPEEKKKRGKQKLDKDRDYLTPPFFLKAFLVAMASGEPVRPIEGLENVERLHHRFGGPEREETTLLVVRETKEPGRILGVWEDTEDNRTVAEEQAAVLRKQATWEAAQVLPIDTAAHATVLRKIQEGDDGARLCMLAFVQSIPHYYKTADIKSWRIGKEDCTLVTSDKPQKSVRFEKEEWGAYIKPYLDDKDKSERREGARFWKGKDSLIKQSRDLLITEWPAYNALYKNKLTLVDALGACVASILEAHGVPLERMTILTNSPHIQWTDIEDNGECTHAPYLAQGEKSILSAFKKIARGGDQPCFSYRDVDRLLLFIRSHRQMMEAFTLTKAIEKSEQPIALPLPGAISNALKQPGVFTDLDKKYPLALLQIVALLRLPPYGLKHEEIQSATLRAEGIYLKEKKVLLLKEDEQDFLNPLLKSRNNEPSDEPLLAQVNKTGKLQGVAHNMHSHAIKKLASVNGMEVVPYLTSSRATTLQALRGFAAAALAADGVSVEKLTKTTKGLKRSAVETNGMINSEITIEKGLTCTLSPETQNVLKCYLSMMDWQAAQQLDSAQESAAPNQENPLFVYKVPIDAQRVIENANKAWDQVCDEMKNKQPATSKGEELALGEEPKSDTIDDLSGTMASPQAQEMDVLDKRWGQSKTRSKYTIEPDLFPEDASDSTGINIPPPSPDSDALGIAEIPANAPETDDWPWLADAIDDPDGTRTGMEFFFSVQETRKGKEIDTSVPDRIQFERDMGTRQWVRIDGDQHTPVPSPSALLKAYANEAATTTIVLSKPSAKDPLLEYAQLEAGLVEFFNRGAPLFSVYSRVGLNKALHAAAFGTDSTEETIDSQALFKGLTMVFGDTCKGGKVEPPLLDPRHAFLLGTEAHFDYSQAIMDFSAPYINDSRSLFDSCAIVEVPTLKPTLVLAAPSVSGWQVVDETKTDGSPYLLNDYIEAKRKAKGDAIDESNPNNPEKVLEQKETFSIIWIPDFKRAALRIRDASHEALPEALRPAWLVSGELTQRWQAHSDQFYDVDQLRHLDNHDLVDRVNKDIDFIEAYRTRFEEPQLFQTALVKLTEAIRSAEFSVDEQLPVEMDERHWEALQALQMQNQNRGEKRNSAESLGGDSASPRAKRFAGASSSIAPSDAQQDNSPPFPAHLSHPERALPSTGASWQKPPADITAVQSIEEKAGTIVLQMENLTPAFNAASYLSEKPSKQTLWVQVYSAQERTIVGAKREVGETLKIYVVGTTTQQKAASTSPPQILFAGLTPQALCERLIPTLEKLTSKEHNLPKKLNLVGCETAVGISPYAGEVAKKLHEAGWPIPIIGYQTVIEVTPQGRKQIASAPGTHTRKTIFEFTNGGIVRADVTRDDALAHTKQTDYGRSSKKR